MKLIYPKARKDEEVVDIMHSVEINDPYRHLEDPFAQETRAFVSSQNELVDSYLSSLPPPSLSSIRATLSSHISFPSISDYELAPDGSHYWLSKGEGPQPVLRRHRCQSQGLSRVEDEQGGVFEGATSGEVFFDVNELSKDGKGTASCAWGSFSPNGRYWATTISRSGSDWQTIRIIDIETKKPVDEELTDVKFCWSIEWLGDEGFVYKTLPPKDSNDATSSEGGFQSKVHYIGQPQSEDIVIWDDSMNPQHSVLVPRVSSDNKWLIFDIFRSADPVIKLLATSLEGRLGPNGKRFTERPEWKLLQKEEFDAAYRYITTTSIGTSLFLHTHPTSTPNAQVVSSTLPSSTYTTLIPHDSSAVLESANPIGDGLLLLIYARNVGHELYIYREDGVLVRKVGDQEVLKGGVVRGWGFKRGKAAKEFSLECESYISPPTIYRGVVKDGDITFSLLYAADVKGWNQDDYVQKQVFYSSQDGIQVPMHLSHSTSLDLSKPHPVLLFAYGGFAWSQLPTFTPFFTSFVHSFSGIVAVANVRGGGEYGLDWHRQARARGKQKSYDDMIAAGRWLREQSWCGSLTVHGSSNGGLMCGAVCNQAPELFDAALPDVGVMDLLRFHRFTMGALWTAEYGDPDDKDDFESLRKVSPLHNISSEPNYPAVLLTTAEHDSRVIPGHTLKFAATLQEKKPDNQKPIICKIWTDTGHGMGKSVDQQAEEGAVKLTFLAVALGLDVRAQGRKK